MSSMSTRISQYFTDVFLMCCLKGFFLRNFFFLQNCSFGRLCATSLLKTQNSWKIWLNTIYEYKREYICYHSHFIAYDLMVVGQWFKSSLWQMQTVVVSFTQRLWECGVWMFGGGQKGRWHRSAASLLSDYPRAAVAMDGTNDVDIVALWETWHEGLKSAVEVQKKWTALVECISLYRKGWIFNSRGGFVSDV